MITVGGPRRKFQPLFPLDRFNIPEGRALTAGCHCVSHMGESGLGPEITKEGCSACERGEGLGKNSSRSWLLSRVCKASTVARRGRGGSPGKRGHADQRLGGCVGNSQLLHIVRWEAAGQGRLEMEPGRWADPSQRGCASCAREHPSHGGIEMNHVGLRWGGIPAASRVRAQPALRVLTLGGLQPHSSPRLSLTVWSPSQSTKDFWMPIRSSLP